MKRNLSSSALNLQAMTVAMAATELKIPFHLSIPQSFRAKDHGAGAEGISFLLLLFQRHAGLKFMFHFLNFSRNVEISGPSIPLCDEWRRRAAASGSIQVGIAPLSIH